MVTAPEQYARTALLIKWTLDIILLQTVVLCITNKSVLVPKIDHVSIDYPKDEAQAALFKAPVHTAL
jgi:hypothetical protein